VLKSELSNDRAGLHIELGFLLLTLLLFLGCSIPETAPARYNCTWTDKGLSWGCTKDGVKFNCEYEHRRGNDETSE
jgi:hypothetical protein